jgi:hypothetical protein
LFIDILRGKIGAGFQMSDVVGESAGANQDRRVHSIIFFVPVVEIAWGFQSKLILKTKQFVDEAYREGTFPLVALSQVDLDPNYRSKIPQLSAFLDIPPDFIFPISNILDQQQHNYPRTFELECSLMNLFLKAASLACANRLCQCVEENIIPPCWM